MPVVSEGISNKPEKREGSLNISKGREPSIQDNRRCRGYVHYTQISVPLMKIELIDGFEAINFRIKTTWTIVSQGVMLV